MAISSGASQRYLESMQPQQPGAATTGVMSVGPTMVKVSDPLEDVEAIVAQMDEATPEGRRRNRWLKRKARHASRNSDGAMTLDGRACCHRLAAELNKYIGTIRVPSKHTCPECGTGWELQMRTREDRHGRR